VFGNVCRAVAWQRVDQIRYNILAVGDGIQVYLVSDRLGEQTVILTLFGDAKSYGENNSE
jgi:hypothetical protein